MSHPQVVNNLFQGRIIWIALLSSGGVLSYLLPVPGSTPKPELIAIAALWVGISFKVQSFMTANFKRTIPKFDEVSQAALILTLLGAGGTPSIGIKGAAFAAYAIIMMMHFPRESSVKEIFSKLTSNHQP